MGSPIRVHFAIHSEIMFCSQYFLSKCSVQHVMVTRLIAKDISLCLSENMQTLSLQIRLMSQ